MAALDTNVLVRYLVGDDKTQFAQATALIEAALARGETLYVPVTVALELEWVLRSNFKFGKEQVTHTLTSLLLSAELSFQNEFSLEQALAVYKDSTADFADCMHAALAYQAGESPLWTFDKAAAKTQGIKLIK